jgi:hypothetical protein
MPEHIEHTFQLLASVLKTATNTQDRAEYEARLRQVVAWPLRGLNLGKGQ